MPEHCKPCKNLTDCLNAHKRGIGVRCVWSKELDSISKMVIEGVSVNEGRLYLEKSWPPRQKEVAGLILLDNELRPYFGKRVRITIEEIE